MIAYNSLAMQINELNPNLKSFWAPIKLNNATNVFDQLIKEPFSVLNTFKIELLILYINNHRDGFVSDDRGQAFYDYLVNADIDISTIFHYIEPYNDTYKRKIPYVCNTILPHYTLHLIIDNVVNSKQYLNQYLCNKVSPRIPKISAYNKILEPNHMSLAIFKQWLTTIKPLNSVQAQAFIKQINNFTDSIKVGFFDAIMSHCPKPSIKLQHRLAYMQFDSTVYQVLTPKYDMHNKGKQCISFSCIWDGQNSKYKPFTTNVARTAPTTVNEMEHLLGSALVLLQQSNYSEQLVTQLIEYATTAKPHLVTQYHNRLTVAHTALTTLLRIYDGN